MAIDAAVQRILDASLAGEGFSESELAYLFKVKPGSAEHEAMKEARLVLKERSRQARGGLGTMFAQIGVDAQPCPGNCFHCSYAARFNTRTPDRWFLADEEVVDYAEDFVRRGANVITPMITAAYDFSHLLELIAMIRERIGEDMPIQMNMGDFTLAQAERMKAAGVTSIFHAVRMGEGLVNDIPLERRFETYAAANEVGFKIGACVENVTPQFTDKAIAHMYYRLRNEVRPQSTGCVSKRLVKGTAGFDQPDFPDDVMGIYQLAVPLFMSGVALFIGGGMMYAEAGTNPRDWTMHTEVDGLIKQRGTSIEGFIADLAADGYIMQPGPSPHW